MLHVLQASCHERQRTVGVGVIAAPSARVFRTGLCAAFLSAVPVAAAEPDVAPAEVIVVTGTRVPEPADHVPTAVTVIRREDLDRSPLVLADDLLRTAPSVTAFRRSSSAVADPTSQGPSLRGVGSSAVSRALVLRDGVPANDPFGGWMYWRSVSPLGIDRIEIAPSGASALFGNFALGGVVDVRSRAIESRSLDAVLAGGSLGTGRGAIRATDRFGEIGIAFDAEGFRTSGYTPIRAAQRGPVDHEAASDHAAAGARIEHVRGGSTLHVSGRWFDEHLDAGTQFSTADVRAVTYGAGWRYTRGSSALQLEVFGGDQRFAQSRARVAMDRSTAALASEQVTPSSDQGALATWTMRLGSHTLLVGADARRVEGIATDRLSPPMPSPTSLVERSAGGEQRFAGVFVQDAVQLSPRIEAAAALRLDGWQNRDGHTRLAFADGSDEIMALEDRLALQLDPRVGVLVRATEIVALRASVYRAFRAPTLNELYRPFQVGTILTAANADLRPETLWGAEGGPQITVDGIDVRATAFWNELSDAIANVTLAEPIGSATRQRQNLGQARIAGIELSARWQPSRAWTLAVAHTFVDAEITSAPAQPELVGKPLPQNPTLRATALVAYEDPQIASLSAQVRYLGRMFEDDLAELSIGAVVLVDARVARAITGGLSAFVAAQNLFDRRYLVGRAGVDTEGAPRTFELGLALRR